MALDAVDVGLDVRAACPRRLFHLVVCFLPQSVVCVLRLGPFGRGGAVGSAGPRRGAGGLAVVRLSLKQVVPGSVPPWRAPLFSWPRSDFRLPGFFVPLPRFSTSGHF